MTTLCGPPLEDVPGLGGSLTLGGFLVEVAERFAQREALAFLPDDGPAVRWTYGDLLDQADRVGRALVAAGIGRGARVGILMGNRPEAVAAIFGAARAGAVVVPLSTFSTRPELEYMLSLAGIEVVLAQDRLLGRPLGAELVELARPGRTDDAARLPFLQRIVVLDTDGPPRPEVRAEGATDWQTFLAAGHSVTAGHLRARAESIHPSDDGLVIFSSGTTDRPKAMLHSQRAPVLQFWLQARVFGRTEATRLWTALPLFWTAGFNTAMGPTLAGGGAWVMQETFEPGAALALMSRERVTEPYCLPHQTAALAEHPDWESTDLSSLTCVFGKSAFARHPSVQGDPAWNSPVAYGLSETCSIFATHHHDTARPLLRASTGRLLPGNRLRVVDPDTGEILGAGQDGELAVSGPTLMERYLGRNREECFDPDGFFHTGDVGFFDQDGYLHWTGRRSEMIKTAGANVSPAEVEVQLRALPALKLARVIGVPDDRLGQMVVLAAVVSEGQTVTANEIASFLRERVASYKVPKRVVFFQDGEIPMTTSETKVRDSALLELVVARLQQEEVA